MSKTPRTQNEIDSYGATHKKGVRRDRCQKTRKAERVGRRDNARLN